jgi:hypothetical protein
MCIEKKKGNFLRCGTDAGEGWTMSTQDKFFAVASNEPRTGSPWLRYSIIVGLTLAAAAVAIALYAHHQESRNNAATRQNDERLRDLQERVRELTGR